ncbi:MAG TPA: hypothetical protein VHS34_14605 [Terriglobales bacterium]|jgi:hypothetical protein|nr:hypothetical protein [Terriglobales bacterium]
MFHLSTSRRSKFVSTVVLLLLATPGWTRVLLRWTQPAIPTAASLGVSDLVIPIDAEALIKSAHGQGYRVYAEVPIAKVSTRSSASPTNDLAGIILDPGDGSPTRIDEALRALRSSYPGLPVAVLDARAKQPQMKGQLVIKRDGILQVTSPTAQPWIDSNLALVRLDQAFRPEQTPLYEFRWDLSDSLQQEQGPDAADYLLAVAEAAAFHSDLVLDLHPKLEAGMLQHDAAAWSVMNKIKPYLAFSSEAARDAHEPVANVGVITDSFRDSYEPVNLLARHNIPFLVLTTSDVKPHSLDGFDLLVIFTTADGRTNEQTITAITDFANRGGTAVLVGARGAYPWQSSPPTPSGQHAVSYISGKGRIIELAEPVTDPETFAQDIRRLLDKADNANAPGQDAAPISLWNALTTVAVPYRVSAGGEEVIELVNYAQEALRVQVKVKGSFTSIRYETPEKGCCEPLTPVLREGFTEFVVPSLYIAGRVHLAGGKAPLKAEGK